MLPDFDDGPPGEPAVPGVPDLDDDEPADAGPMLPDLDDDLFQEDDDETEAEAEADDAEASDLSDLAQVSAPSEEAKPKIPLPIMIGAGGLLVLILVVWLGTKMLSSDSDSDADVDAGSTAVTDVLARAEKMFQAGNVERAVTVLEEFKPSEADLPRIELRLKKYRQALIPPTPTTDPRILQMAEQLRGEGKWLAACEQLLIGLDEHPDDKTLLEFMERIYQFDPQVVELCRTMGKGDHGVAVSLSRELVARYPANQELAAPDDVVEVSEVVVDAPEAVDGQEAVDAPEAVDEPEAVDGQDFVDALERNLFNWAVEHLQAFDLGGAETLLNELVALRPDDQEVGRILTFIEKYKNLPDDPQLKIYIRSLEYR